MVRRATSAYRRQASRPRRTIAGLAFGIGHCSFTDWPSWHLFPLQIVTLRNQVQHSIEKIVVLAGSMVVFAVGMNPPHVGVWRAELPNVLNARSMSAATGRAGCSKLRPGKDDPISSRRTW